MINETMNHRDADQTVVIAGGSVTEYLCRLLTTGMVGLGGVLMVSALLSFVLTPILYDTLHLQDTLFFAELGWRVQNGATPVLDFGHFYGGVVATYVAWAFALFGTTVKSIDYAFVMMLLTTVALGVIVSIRRLTPFSIVALGLIAFACVLSRVPFEELTAIQRPTSAHSFIYNRFATSLAAVLAVFAMVQSPSRLMELGSALLCGVAAYLIVLIKPTFVTFFPAFFLALAVMGRWRVLGVAVLGFALGLMLLDPFAQKVTGAFGYAISAASDRAGVSDLILKSVAVVLVQPLHLLLALLAMVVVLKWGGRGSVRVAAAAVILMAGFIGMTATMGWRGSIGQQALPLLAAISIGFYEWYRRSAGPLDGADRFLKVTAACITMTFALPQLAQSTLGAIVGQVRQDLILTEGTPLDTYLAWSDEFVSPEGQSIKSPTPLEHQTPWALAHLQAGLPQNVGVEYVQIADGIELLRQVPDIADRRLAGDYGVFTFAMQTKPVLGFPVWVNSTAAEFAENVPLSSEIELMMIKTQSRSASSHVLLDKMQGAFETCMTSAFWELYVKKGSDTSFCVPASG